MVNIGDTIGKLTVLEKDIMTPNGQKYLCKCECGNTMDRDYQASLNLKGYGENVLKSVI